jgi:hypothetical protein
MDGEAGTATVAHAFESRGPWWDLCAICGLSEPAHVSSLALGGLLMATKYRCPYCVGLGAENCKHRGAPIGLDGQSLEGSPHG